MGAPKQKWTAEEEAALKAGVNKHGAGKWRTILKDLEYSGVLAMRSNVDLKDKWRNMSVMNNGWGSRDKSRLVIKRAAQSARQEENLTSASDVPMSDEDTVDTHPSAMDTSGTSTPAQVSAPPKKSIVRLDNLIMEAISNLKEPSGSNKTSIASYIEDKYWIPADFKRLLSAKLIFLVSTGKLLKVKRCYRIAPYSSSSDRRRNLPMITQDGRQLNGPRDERDDQNVVTRSQIDVELAKMRSMTAQEAAAAAARAVAEAEAAIAEAEEAAREAEAAEADAQAAQAFAEEATRSLRGRIAQKVVIRA